VLSQSGGLERVLEPEVMDSELDAREYQAIGNGEVNREFVSQALRLAPLHGLLLDAGTGPGDIAILLARSAPEIRVIAIDLADQMLAIARDAVARAGLGGRVEVARRDAKETGYPAAKFDMVMSNSLVHHIPEPIEFFREVARVARPGAGVFIKDLLRPRSNEELLALVVMHAAKDTDYQQMLFANSLRAALRVDEVELLCRQAGLRDVTVRQTSDRHWTIERAATHGGRGERP
jgi:ubiquinone/menaquinone biosynthesis C-methylase UbiE